MNAILNRREIIEDINFGEQIAEDERDNIPRYFIENRAYKRIKSGKSDIVFGEKGSGKSAIYFKLFLEKEKLRDERNVLIIPAEEIRDNPAFSEVSSDDLTDDITSVWKLYSLSLIVQTLRDDPSISKSLSKIVKLHENKLVVAGLLPQSSNATLAELARNAMKYVNFKLTGRVGARDFGGEATIEIRALTTLEKNSGLSFVDDMIKELDQNLGEIKIWIAFDRLDVAFKNDARLEREALKALFRLYQSLRGSDNIRVLIFLRKDIWIRVNEGRAVPERSHIDVKSVDISWEEDDLKSLVSKRVLESKKFRTAFNVTRECDSDTVLNHLLPDQVEKGSRKSKSFRWILKRTASGTEQGLVYSPREIIALLEEAREIEENAPQTKTKTIISSESIRKALPAISKKRIHSNLYPEFPHLESYIKMLRQQKCEHNLKSLKELWCVTEVKAEELADGLVTAGFFQKKDDTYWIPFVFRPELKLVQGKAVKLRSH